MLNQAEFALGRRIVTHRERAHPDEERPRHGGAGAANLAGNGPRGAIHGAELAWLDPVKSRGAVSVHCHASAGITLDATLVRMGDS
jgi:hypothetical protein